MSKEVEDFAEATTFAIKSMQLAVTRLADEVELLRDAFLRLHPNVAIPILEQTEAEQEFLAQYAHLLNEDPK